MDFDAFDRLLRGNIVPARRLSSAVEMPIGRGRRLWTAKCGSRGQLLTNYRLRKPIRAALELSEGGLNGGANLTA